MPLSEYERASVDRRIALLREYICTLGLEDLSPGERARNMRSALSELRQLEGIMAPSDSELERCQDPVRPR